MLFIVVTSLITILCLLGLIRTARDRNALGVVISLIATLVFGWFSIMTFLEWLRNMA